MKLIIQMGVVFAIYWASQFIEFLLPFSFPASVISMVLLLALLMTGVVKQRQIQTLSEFLVVNMGLFFVPALVGTIQYADVLGSQLVAFLVVTFLTTPVVYLVTAWTVQGLMHLMKKKGGGQDA